MNSEAFVKVYGDKPVWFHYRRNHKGRIPPRTRKNCIRNGHIDTASPCPICRDEYLKNSKLLEQFISPYTGEILDSRQIGLCQKQHKTLLVEIFKAWDGGEVEAPIPFRTYNYDDYKS
ncbi:small ribosomal subunit protein mS40-like [Physella acuta]|uniref:small ribosomal subunit protein mS40-like n=1 Tax=Physella acuta TaxID=109671 RepID=UPI0027DE21AB|nr:small ribosomal subunit protein mS40-like [Physella acuta]